jgi:hypothetical protein
MEERKHTPGPWALMDFGAYGDFEGRSQVVMSEPLSGDNPFRIAVVHVSAKRDDQGAANARLIAAAPHLLEALQGLVARYKFDGIPNDSLPFVEAARAAISKAASG